MLLQLRRPFLINNPTSGQLPASIQQLLGLNSPSPIKGIEMTRDCSNISLRTANSHYLGWNNYL
jgi:hypothetical protein